MQDNINAYIAELNKYYSSGKATEYTYRGPLQDLIGSLLPKGYTLINEPTREDCGAPDYIILKGDIPQAYIETKTPQDGDLDGNSKNKPQFDRYRNSLNHIVFTDYLDFHLYDNGEFSEAVRLADVRGDKIVLIPESVDKFEQMVKRLANATLQRITSPARLAKVMASKARLLADVIEKALDNDTNEKSELAQ